MEKALGAMQKTKTVLRPFYRLIMGLPFWVMALFCFFLRLFVKRPLGPLLALITGCVWVYNNINSVKVFFVSFRNRCAVNFHDYEKTSLWYEHVGREKIKALIIDLSAKGVNFCNLTRCLDDMPPISHWHAISTELSVIGVSSQISGNEFYISWRLQAQPEENNGDS